MRLEQITPDVISLCAQPADRRSFRRNSAYADPCSPPCWHMLKIWRQHMSAYARTNTAWAGRWLAGSGRPSAYLQHMLTRAIHLPASPMSICSPCSELGTVCQGKEVDSEADA